MAEQHKIKVLAKKTFNPPMGSKLIVRGDEVLVDVYEGKELARLGLVEILDLNPEEEGELEDLEAIQKKYTEVTGKKPGNKKPETLLKEIEEAQNK